MPVQLVNAEMVELLKPYFVSWRTYTQRRIACRVYNSGNISIADITETPVTFDSESYDDAGFHSTSSNTSYLTAPYDGVYIMSGGVRWAGVNVGRRNLSVTVNGTVIAKTRMVNLTADTLYQAITTQYQMTAGQYTELVVQHNRGSAVNIETEGAFGIWFSIARVR